MTQFDFGRNWKEFSKKALTGNGVSLARNDFAALLENIDIRGKDFLDIGFGQGMSLLIAAEFGARAVGCDINPKCKDAFNYNKKHFTKISGDIPVIIGSILEESVLEKIRKESASPDGKYDVVHAWGVLHHTGNMRLAVKNAALMVKDKGYFILAIYNRHWSSPVWKAIKYIYCKSPDFIKILMAAFFYLVIYAAIFAITGRDPKKQKERGMDFYYDVIDWIGGYPYEYASSEEVKKIVEGMGMFLLKTIPPPVGPTGNNQFIFRKGLDG